VKVSAAFKKTMRQRIKKRPTDLRFFILKVYHCNAFHPLVVFNPLENAF
jgi:hypothetical protein